ncbi:MAG: hypothetical protein ACK5JT_14725 [Hyphomicrobiaceae bacterium]
MKSMRAVALGICLVAGGCAAAVPGYTPETAKSLKYKAHAQTGGGFDANGNYHMTDQEKGLNCKQLTGSMTIKILQMRESLKRVPPSALARFSQEQAREFSGGTRFGSDFNADLRRDHKRLETLNRALAAKKCPTFDIAHDLKPGNTARPHPVRTRR